MPQNDHTLRFIQLRFFALGNQLVLQIVVPGVFIFKSGLNQYGLWLVVNSFAGFLAFLDLGLFAVIPTDAMVQSHEKLTDLERGSLAAMKGYSILVSSVLIFSFSVMIIVGRIFDISSLKSDFFFYVFLAVVNASLIFLLRYYEASFRSVNSTYGFGVQTLHATASTFFTILVLALNGTILNIFLTNLTISLLFLIQFFIKGDAYENEHFRFQEIFRVIRKFSKKGLAYQLFSVGYLLINQGIILLIQHLGGFKDVGILGAIRVLAGVFRQISSVFVNSALPQLGLLLKAKSFEEAALYFTRVKNLVYRINSFILFILVFGLIAYFFLVNPSIHEIPILTCLYFVISAAFDVPWNVWVSLPFSTNRHVHLGFRFILSSALTLLLSAPMYKYLGLQGIALALIIQDLLMTRQSIRAGRQILGLG